MKLPRVFYITGTPGVGKTEVGRALAKDMRAVFIDLNEEIKKRKMYTSYDRSTRSFIADARKIRPFLKDTILNSRGSIVISSHLVFPLPKIARPVIVVLRVSPVKLMRRLERRGYGRMKIAENVSAELLDLSFHEASSLGMGRVIEIDATELSAKEVAYAMRKIVKRGTSSGKKPKTDWIRILEKHHKLSVVINFLSSTSGN